MIELTDFEFREISDYIRMNYGVNLERKRPLIEGRLGFYVESLGFRSYSDFFRFVRNDPTQREITKVLDRLTTNHTYFMREEDHFTFYSDVILPQADAQNERDLRVWSAGCSSGQEAYMLSIVTLEYLGYAAPLWDARILASDISERALNTGKAGIYAAKDLCNMSGETITRWFVKEGEDQYRVSERLRKNVVFRRSNLLDPFTIKKPFHAIFCRNVMIYFNNETKEKLVAKFYDALRPDGYLFIGHSESLSTLKHDFQYVSPSIYRK